MLLKKTWIKQSKFYNLQKIVFGEYEWQVRRPIDKISRWSFCPMNAVNVADIICGNIHGIWYS